MTIHKRKDQGIRARRDFSATEKAELVLHSLSSAQSNAKCYREKGITPSNFYIWRNFFISAGTAALKKKARLKKGKSGCNSQLDSSLNLKLELLEQYVNCLRPEASLGCRLPENIKLQIIDLVEKSELKQAYALRIIGIPKSTFCLWREKLGDHGRVKNYQTKASKVKVYEVPETKEVVLKILHSPPIDYGYNRTTWKFSDLQKAIERSGVRIGRSSIRKIIKSAGYRWLKAKKVLTSKDPDYKSKLESIQTILGNLNGKEGFFSIDEYGPFAVKQRQGRKLIGPGETFTVPQWQKSKGVLIMTAALELSSNQVTHFYSHKKNTAEMIKLLDLLLSNYKHLDRIYLSWDAASWHISKKLFEKIDSNNTMACKTGATSVEVAPLPAGAQFLNVIEAVFSGMSRAIIHNSNYQSIEEAKNAIDTYFKERNQAFIKNPQKAGKKIWGKEPVAPYFSESQNCKDSRYR